MNKIKEIQEELVRQHFGYINNDHFELMFSSGDIYKEKYSSVENYTDNMLDKHLTMRYDEEKAYSVDDAIVSFRDEIEKENRCKVNVGDNTFNYSVEIRFNCLPQYVTFTLTK